MLTIRLLATLSLLLALLRRTPVPPPPVPGEWQMGTCLRAAMRGYECYGTWEGVSFFARFRQPRAASHRAEGWLGIHSGRTEAARVSWATVWTCADGTVHESTTQGDRFAPGETRSGEPAGMRYSPCPRGTRIAYVQLRARVRAE